MPSIKTNTIIVFLLLLFILPSQSNAQEWARKMFKEFQHDFGTITKESRPVHKFEIENLYNEDIRIRDVFSSCGCTSVSVTKRVLKTYEKAYIVARFNSHIVDGPKQATVTVRFDAPFVAEVQLVVRGNSVYGGGVQVSSKNVDFGNVISGQAAQRTIQLSRQGDSTFKIVDVLSTYPHIGVSLNEKYRGQNVVAYDVNLKLKESVPSGYSQGELFIMTEDRNRLRTKIPVKFTAKVVPPVQISPEIMTLSPVKKGQEIRKKVVVKADQPFQIVDVTCVSRSFRVRADGSSKKVHFVDVIYDGNEEPGRHERVLTFVTNLGGNSSATMKAIVDVVDSTATAENVPDNGLSKTN